jgi:hypothetical protein
MRNIKILFCKIQTAKKQISQIIFVKKKFTEKWDFRTCTRQRKVYEWVGCHLDVVRGPNTPHDPESDAGGSLSSWQGHPSR